MCSNSNAKQAELEILWTMQKMSSNKPMSFYCNGYYSIFFIFR